MRLWAVLFVVIAMTAPSVYNLVVKMDVFKTLQPPTDNAAKCKVHHQYESGTRFAHTGFEDVVYVDQSTAVGCAGSIQDLVLGSGPGNANLRVSECALMSWVGNAFSIKSLRIVGFPDNEAFRVHGLSLFRPDESTVQLFAINHGGSQSGERIDVFVLSLKKGTLVWKGRVFHPLFEEFNGALNDLVVVSDKSLYVTTELDPTLMEPTLWAKLRLVFGYFRLLIFGNMNTKILHCKYEIVVSGSGTTQCSVAASNIGLANGIDALTMQIPRSDPTPQDTSGKQPLPHAALATVLFVSDMLGHSLRVFTVDPKTSALFEFFEEAIVLRDAVDNLNLAPLSVKGAVVALDRAIGPALEAVLTLHVASISSLSATNRLLLDTSPSVTAPGALTRVDVRVSMNTTAIRHGENAHMIYRVVKQAELPLVQTDGLLLSGISAGVVLSSPAAASQLAVVGSFARHGLMTCPVFP